MQRVKRRVQSTRRATFELLEDRRLLATLTVNSWLDNNLAGDGLVTLREAIAAANTNTATDLGEIGSGADTIVFDSATFATPRTTLLTLGEMQITEALTIEGPGQDLLTINAQLQSRIFNITNTSGDFAIFGLTLTRGQSAGDGGAIRSSADLIVAQSTISGNAAASLGGGIFASDGMTATVIDSSISDNSTVMGYGGGIFGGKVTLTNSSVSGNTGGGVFAISSVSVTDSTVSGNNGFGVYARPYLDLGHSPPVVTITHSAVSGNSEPGIAINPAGLEYSTLTAALVNNSVVNNNGGSGIFFSWGKLVATDSTVSDNHGTGIDSSSGEVTLNSSTVSGNDGDGIAIGHNSMGVTLNSSTVTGNGGSGIYSHSSPALSGGAVTLTDSTVSDNRGRGITAYASGVTLNSSTVSGNTSMGNGGGIWSYGDVTLNSSTVSGNRALDGGHPLLLGDGGGIFIGGITGSVSVRSSTIAGNHADHFGGGIGIYNSYGHVGVDSSIVAGNTAAATGADLSFPVNSYFTHELRYSLVGDNAGTSLVETHTADANGNLIGSSAGSGIINPQLAPLTNNGGPTQTHALLPGSPAIDAIPSFGMPTNYDQRGEPFARVADGDGINGLQLDMGAFELNSNLAPVVEAESSADVGADALGQSSYSFSITYRDDSALAVATFDTADASVNGPSGALGVISAVPEVGSDGSPRTVAYVVEPPGGTWDHTDNGVYTIHLVTRQVGDDGTPQLFVPAGQVGSFQVSVPPFVDYGDAPDSGAGTGPGNYNTLSTDNGPQHTIVVGLRMGANVDKDDGTLQNLAANADDVNSALPDDEDGLVNPAADLVLTVGAQPTVNVLVTNTTGTAATLYGWIDYNDNGVFDNVAERASVAVPNGTNNGIVTLVFPAVPTGFTGTTYARFRLSTDAAAANPTGPASNGEVEDYRATITKPSSGLADSAKTKKLASSTNGGPTLANNDAFGNAVASMGDLNGDGVTDLVVGAQSTTLPGGNGGALYVLFMNADGTVQSSQKIGSGIGGGPILANGDYFGRSIVSLGDLDGDGITDLAVGADRDNAGGSLRGAVYVLLMNANGTVKGSQKIAHNIGGGPTLANADRFGGTVAALGDLDGDGLTDLAVGASGDDTGGTNRGAAYVLFLNANGTVKSSQKIASGTGGGPVLANSDYFGGAVASPGDLDGDGVTDLAVGAWGDDSGGSGRGAVHVLFLNANGTVKGSQKIASGVGGGPATLANNDFFGSSLAALGDLDGDGVTDLAVGARYDDTGGTDRGAIHVLYLNANGTAKGSQKIANGTGGGPILADGDIFSRSIASIGDLDGDGVTDLSAGAERDDTGGTNRGAVHVLFLKKFNNNPVITSPATANVAENTTAVITVTASDVDLPPQTVTFSLVGGADQAKFGITGGGVLSFTAAPNFEAPTDANGDNVYVVTVQASDSEGATATQTISVTVTPVNDNIPVFTSPTTSNLPENTTVVMALTATDADLPTQPVTFSLAGGADQSKFELTSGGVLSFNAPPDYEMPTDANGDNLYVVIVQASDGNLTNLDAILVTVTNVLEPPAGDYNLDGTVDAADYTVWRDTLGAMVAPFSGADGDGDGQVDSDDYQVWKANFGNTSAGSGSTALASTPPTQSNAGELPALAHSVAPALTRVVEPVAGTVRMLSSPTAAVIQSAARRSNRLHLTKRVRPLVAASHDDAIVAWLAAKSAGARHDWAAEDFADLLRDPDSPDPPGEFDSALDLAFDSLAV